MAQEMQYEGIQDEKFSLILCGCGMRIRVVLTQYRVECPCGASAILHELRQKAEKPDE